MADLTEFYRILGIDPASSPEVITAARDELTRVWNPERFPNDNRIRQMAIVKIAEINAAHDVLIAHLNVGVNAGAGLPNVENESGRAGTGNCSCDACGNLPVKAEELFCSFCGARNLIETQNGHGIVNQVDCRVPSRANVVALQQNSLKKRAYFVLLIVIASVGWFWFSSHQDQEATPPKITDTAASDTRPNTQSMSESHLAYFILDMVEQLDFSKVYASSKADVQGQPSSYDPKMMTALLFYSYCTGVPSSRQIEKKTYEDPVFRVISGNRHPHHFAVIDFRNRQTGTLSDLFVQMLQLCQKAGFAEVGNVAVGTNLPQHKETASGMVKKKKEELEKQVQALFKKAESVDREEDKRYGTARRGWDLPAELQRSGS
jgi:transposase